MAAVGHICAYCMQRYFGDFRVHSLECIELRKRSEDRYPATSRTPILKKGPVRCADFGGCKSAVEDNDTDYCEQHRFWRRILSGLEWGRFKFPDHGIDGVIGSICISEAVDLFLAQRTEEEKGDIRPTVALLITHLNFKFSATKLTERSPILDILLTDLHLTVRRKKCQDAILVDGSSILTSRESIHCGFNGIWGPDRGWSELILSLENNDRMHFTKDEILNHLKRERLGGDFWYTMAGQLMDQILITIKRNVGAVTIRVNSDASWTGRGASSSSSS